MEIGINAKETIARPCRAFTQSGVVVWPHPVIRPIGRAMAYRTATMPAAVTSHRS